VSRSPNSPQFFTTAQVAKVLGRSPVTVRRLARKGVLPPAQWVNGERRYTQADLQAVAEAASAIGFANDQPTRGLIAQLKTALLGPPAAPPAGLDAEGPEGPVRPWQETPESTVTSWAALSGQSPAESTVGRLPTICTTCGRAATRRSFNDPQGRRVLIATCDVHHELGRLLWT
jgi:hypothetical protein